MNFNKIGLITLSAGAVFMAAGCNKDPALNYDKALEWVEKHYKKEDATNATSGLIKADFTGTTGTILEGIKNLLETLYITLDDDLKADEPVAAEVLELTSTMYMSANQFKGRFSDGKDEGYTFAVKNNSFIIAAERSNKKDPKSSGVLNWEENYNSKCALTKISMSIKDLKDEETGSVGNGYFTVTYNY